MTRTRRRADAEVGSATLELAILAPAVLLLLGLVIVGGRIEIAGGAVEQASAQAARAASLARTPDAARQAATETALATLTGQDLHCSHVDVSVDTSGFAVAVGNAAQVSARVTCTLDLSAVGVPGLPGRRTLTAQTQSVLDRYRSR